MPTYEHVVDGQIVERSTTLAEHPFDAQMAALVVQQDSGWRRVDEPITAPTPEAIPPAPTSTSTAEVPAQAAPAESAPAEAPAPSQSDSTPIVVGEACPEPTDLPPSTETPATTPKEQ